MYKELIESALYDPNAYNTIQNLQCFNQQSIFSIRMRILATKLFLSMLLLKCILSADASDVSPSESSSDSSDREKKGQDPYHYKPKN